MTLRAPFPYFGGKRDVIDLVWQRFGRVRQYIEPFCGSAAMLLGAPEPASLEVVNDANGFIANFWRAVKSQPAEVAREADYPVSHIDLGAAQGHLRVAVCGHHGDYPKLDAAGYRMVPWTRRRFTYSGSGTTDREAIWFSPACIEPAVVRQMEMFG